MSFRLGYSWTLNFWQLTLSAHHRDVGVLSTLQCYCYGLPVQLGNLVNWLFTQSTLRIRHRWSKHSRWWWLEYRNLMSFPGCEYLARAVSICRRLFTSWVVGFMPSGKISTWAEISLEACCFHFNLMHPPLWHWNSLESQALVSCLLYVQVELYQLHAKARRQAWNVDCLDK